MNRILSLVKTSECLTNVFIWKLVWMLPVDKKTMEELAQGGRLQFYPHFPRPYYRIERTGMVIQGITGDAELQVTTGMGCENDIRRQLEGLLTKGE